MYARVKHIPALLSLAGYLAWGTVMAQDNGSDSDGAEGVEWREDLVLDWKDFQGKIPRYASAAATTASGISYGYTARIMGTHARVDADITAFFYPTESWYRPEVCDDHILGHEQLHFDIAELFARKMRQRMEATRFSENVKAEVRAIYQETLQELRAFQEAYDESTDYSRNREAQRQWRYRVSELLKGAADPGHPGSWK